jgi:phosphoribosylpyrophosphate synthetase
MNYVSVKLSISFCKHKINVSVNIGDPEGKHVVIVDDLVQTGGTLIQCGKVSYSL